MLTASIQPAASESAMKEDENVVLRVRRQVGTTADTNTTSVNFVPSANTQLIDR